MGSDGNKFVVIDGNSLLYRAFFAMRYLSTSDGRPTNALYGLTVMLLKILEDKPDYIAVAFDTPKPTFRHEEFDAYKAHRKPTPDALIEQGPLARDLIRAFAIPVVEVEGFEADDVIGAMAKVAEKEGLKTVIVTGDLDALQLVNEHTHVMTTVKGVSDTVEYDPAAVEERFGLRPDQMIDYKGLKGDPSDNIPGVPGIGDKTALSLLKEYETMDNLLDHLDDLPEGKVKKTLQENVEKARLSKRLATIVTDLPIVIDPTDYKAKEPDYDVLRDMFVRLEFKTLIKRIPEVEPVQRTMTSTQRTVLGACRRIDSSAELKELISSLEGSGEFALRTKTSDGKSIEAEIVGLSFSTGSGETVYVDVVDPSRHSDTLELKLQGGFEADLSDFKKILESHRIKKYCHDGKLNHAAMMLRGINLDGVEFDTMLAAYVIDSTRGSFDIGDVAFEQLSLELPGVVGRNELAGELETVCGEAEAIYRLKPVMEERLKQDNEWELYENVELPLAPILADMEITGVALDVEQLMALSVTLEVDIRDVEEKVYEQAGERFNIGSTKQLQTVLFDKLGLQASKKTKTGYSTSAAALEEMAVDYPIVDDVLKYRELTKLKSTYADALPKLINPKTGRIHTSLNQTVTSTGRLSSSDPNLQNIPIRTELGRQIRKAFVASGDKLLLSADYSQIELRILAHITGDPGLVRAFENDEDIHTATACTLFNCSPEEVNPEMRRRAKTINFAVIYGIADFTLSRSLGIGVKEAREYINTYFDKFEGVRRYIDDTIEQARRLGYVTTLMGRRRYIPEINSSNRNFRLFAERAATNMPIQGTAADLMKLAMIRIYDELDAAKLKTKMLLQVHDELLLEVPPSEIEEATRILRYGMQDAYKMRVPLKVDVKVGKSWADMEVAE